MKSLIDNLKVGAWFLIPGLIVLAVGLSVLNSNSVKSSDVVTVGHYISVDTDRLHATKNSSNGKILHYPAVIEYIDSAGQKLTLNTSVPSLPLPALNSEVQVAYDKTHPDKAREASKRGEVIAFIALGIGLALVGLGVILTSGILQHNKQVNGG